MDSLNGKIACHSEIDKGTKFKVLIPITVIEHAHLQVSDNE